MAERGLLNAFEHCVNPIAASIQQEAICFLAIRKFLSTKWTILSDFQGNSLTGPFIGFSHCPVEVINELVDLSSEIVFRSEVSTFDNFSGYDTKPDLHLIEQLQCFGV